MFKKFGSLALFALLATTSLNAQHRRDFRREREQLAREERAEKRRMREERGQQPGAAYGTNILRVAPLTVMDVGVGFGISYEKILDKNQMIGLILPVHFLISDNDDFFSGNNNSLSNTQTYFYFTPGLKVYPFGQRRVTYAVGPSLMLGYGGGKDYQYDYLTGLTTDADIRKFRLGMLVNNYVNFQLGPTFNLGLELGIGVRYLDQERVEFRDYTRTENKDLDATGQFSLTLGYRF
ncbi:hypothetical protein [Taibaiella koreensis]|uniref:hypothetical protein n=1 Tax=Taibaiella koreensis TaxID=1268548 RepID=UPI000E59A923|nr:hypothetical protein [Taibaiella koreensis]